MLRKIFFLLAFVVVISNIHSQEIQARLTILTNKISTQVDKKIFQTLQTALTNFINNRKWTRDVFQPNEKIQCSFLISLETDAGNNVYKGKLTVQAARPIFNSSY